MAPSMWIEHDPQGRPYYVKRKPSVPSLRHKFAEAFREIRNRQTTSSGSAPVTADIAPNEAKSVPGETAKNQPSTGTMPQDKKPATPVAHPHPQVQMYYNPYNPYAQFPHAGVTSNQHQALVPRHTFAQPYPGNGIHVNQSGQVGGNQHQPYVHNATNLPPPGMPQGGNSANMPGIAQQMQLQPGMLPMAMNPEGLKFKCMVCGRFRSPKYHIKHKLAPGQLPGPTVCRRCRKKAVETDSQGSESYEDMRALHRSLSRARSVSRGRTSRAASRARSLSRMSRRVEDFDFYAGHVSESESDSLGGQPSVQKSIKGRRTTPKLKAVHYLEDPHLVARSRSRSRARKIIYVQDSQDQSTSEGEEFEVRYVKSQKRCDQSFCGRFSTLTNHTIGQIPRMDIWYASDRQVLMRLPL